MNLPDFNGQRVYIAPHSPRTCMFQKTFCEHYPQARILGFIDKVKTGEGIHRLEDIIDTTFDAILILSQNHFSSIYSEYRRHVERRRLIQVDIQNDRYVFRDERAISRRRLAALPNRLRLKCLGALIRLLDALHYPRRRWVFIAKSFIGGNTKALYLHMVEQGTPTLLLTDHREQARELREHRLPVGYLLGWRAVWAIATARGIITDQGNYTQVDALLSPRQKTLQMWHGIPLKRMNRLSGITYDYMPSPSDYVNRTSLSQVVPARHYLGCGYPRNDLLLREHSERDLVLTDRGLYQKARATFSTASRVFVYMPTHREAATGIGAPARPLLPLDFSALDSVLAEMDALLIVKLHAFVRQFYEGFRPESGGSRILFHSSEGDIYPILRYTDALITDYSSVYFDFLLLDRPIVFFDYDYAEYSGNMGGFVYDYAENAPGPHVADQTALTHALRDLCQGVDGYGEQRRAVRARFFDHLDGRSAERLFAALT